jgi:hypothetical protein
MTAFDRKLGLECLAHTGLACVLTIAVMVATDETSSTLATRLARLAAFLPALGALGASLALSHARERGELRALEALGVSPLRTRFGAALGAWLVGAAAVGALAAPFTDVRSLFPAVKQPVWLAVGSALLEPLARIRVFESGQLEFAAERLPAPLLPVPAHAAAVLAIAPLALTLPWWAVVALGPAARAAGAGASFVTLVALLHAVAAGRTNQVWLCVAAFPIAAQALWAQFRRAC